MDKIIIEIKGTQNFGGAYDKTELTTVGTMEELDGKYIIKYTEEHENEAPTDVIVTVAKNNRVADVTRNGSICSQLIIERSSRNLCTYATPYGDVLMGISGINIEHSRLQSGGIFRFRYDIDINGALASRNKLLLSYKIKSGEKDVKES